MNEVLNDINFGVVNSQKLNYSQVQAGSNSDANTSNHTSSLKFPNLKSHNVHLSAIIAEDILLESCSYSTATDVGRLVEAILGTIGRLNTQ